MGTPAAVSPEIEQWAVQLALDVAPEEAELAPTQVAAFVEGGSDRAELFRVDGAVPGGFDGGGMITVLVPVFAAVVTAAPLLPTAVKDSLELWERMHRRGASPPVASPGSGAGRDGAVEPIDVRDPIDLRDPEPGAAADAGSVAVLADLRRYSQAFEAELARHGMPRDERQALTYRAVRSVLGNERGTGAFLRAVGSR